MKRLFAFLSLMRPANIITAIADILAGIAISGVLSGVLQTNSYTDILFLCLSTIGLYSGGIVYNDIFDHKLDLIERPERPIPNGTIKIHEALVLGSSLLISGIVAAFIVNKSAGLIAIMITISALVYNKWAKHHPFLGPPTMGLCRGLNLLLGISIIPIMMNSFWHLAIVPIIYISAITLISRGEVHGSNRKPLYIASIFYTFVILSILYFSFTKSEIMIASLFLLGFTWMIFKPLLIAIKNPSGAQIGKAVKAGVISLIWMDAAWAAASGSWILALVIICLWPLSIWVSHLFAVT